MKIWNLVTLLLLVAFTSSCSSTRTSVPRDDKKITRVYIASDSTAADYSDEPDYQAKRFPQVGWGQMLPALVKAESIASFQFVPAGNSIDIARKAKGGRSARSFFEEGRWREIVDALQPGDLVLIQFGHNDQSKEKFDRYTSIDGYKEYLRLYVDQVREKRARPVLLTSVNRNYPWVDGKLQNCHFDYPQAVKEVANEKKVDLIDLQQLSIDLFTAKGEAFVTGHYFMNLPAGKFSAYPSGQKDNTHFQTEGGIAVAQLVLRALQKLPNVF
jgi:lysophospholipase L1-like esterase